MSSNIIVVCKRDNTVVPFDKQKIINAVNGALLEVDGKLYEEDTAYDIANDIEEQIKEKK
jgi:transcriptional regulator NrdR family protein